MGKKWPKNEFLTIRAIYPPEVTSILVETALLPIIGSIFDHFRPFLAQNDVKT